MNQEKTQNEIVIVIDSISSKGHSHNGEHDFIDIAYHEEVGTSDMPRWKWEKDGYTNVRLRIGDGESENEAIESYFSGEVEYDLYK